MNQAEAIHAGWAHWDSENMSLLEVCQADVRDSITLHVEMRTFAARTSSGGGGPSYVQRKRKSYVREVSQAKQFGAEILCNNDIDDNSRIIDPETSFHPKEKKKLRKRKTKQKAGESSILTVGPTSSETSTFPAPSQHPIHDLNLHQCMVAFIQRIMCIFKLPSGHSCR